MTKIFIEVYGCSANVADFEIVSGILHESGYELVKHPSIADAIIILTCTVKTPTENKILRRIRELSLRGIPLIVAGCMPEVQKELVINTVPEASLVGPNNILNIVDAVEVSINGGQFRAVKGSSQDRACLPRIRANPIIHISPIASGCLGDCSYCIVKHARGSLYSYKIYDVIKDAKKALEDGCKEIWVTAEDTAAYNFQGYKLPDLLNKICDLKGKFFVRVGMMTPNQVKPILEDLIKAYSSENIYKFLHLPVQSGSDYILSKMNRKYTVKDFKEIVNRFREAFPTLTLSTDIICGFPGETKEQHKDSIKLVEEIEPDVLNISRFWPRPHTEAAEMKYQLHGRETKLRSREMTKLHKKISLKKNNGWIGWKGEVLIDEYGKEDNMVSRNYVYKPIVLGESLPLGAFQQVYVTKSTFGYLSGHTI